jgi:hypothetical protein
MVGLSCLLVFAGCSGDGGGRSNGGAEPNGALTRGASPGTGSAEITLELAPELNVDLAAMARLPSGLYMKDLQVGEGTELAVNGRQVRVRYKGWLSNGVAFDSTRANGEPVTFTIGTAEVITGWSEGVTGMRAGGRRRLVVPPVLGYGERGADAAIPPNSTLIFDIELVEIVPAGTTTND